MRKQQSQYDSFGEMDEHDAPTYPILPERPAQTASPHTQTRRSSFPIFVGMLFVAVQLLLLVRFVLKLLVLPGNTTWISIIYTVSDVFVQPFRMLMQNFALPMPNG